jgi:hypothetical protein
MIRVFTFGCTAGWLAPTSCSYIHSHLPPTLLMLLQEALSVHEAQSSGVAAERAALRADLERLLRERGTLDSLKRVVVAAVKTQQVGKAVSSFVMLSAPVRALPLCVRTVHDSSPLASHMPAYVAAKHTATQLVPLSIQVATIHAHVIC